MITTTQGNILTASTQAITNPVNCVGVMGKGLALQFKQRFPSAYFLDYTAACRDGRIRPGYPHIYDRGAATTPRWIVNFPTKHHWRDSSDLADIRDGLWRLVDMLRARQITTIALPPLGCGLGGLDWATQGEPLITTIYGNLRDIEAVLYAP